MVQVQVPQRTLERIILRLLAVRRRAGHCGGHGVSGSGIEVFSLEQQRRERLAWVLFDVVGEKAEEQMHTDALLLRSHTRMLDFQQAVEGLDDRVEFWTLQFWFCESTSALKFSVFFARFP